MDRTTIQIHDNVKELLNSLKTELKASDFNQVISELIKSYRETHGWSSIAIAEELKKLEAKEVKNGEAPITSI